MSKRLSSVVVGWVLLAAGCAISPQTQKMAPGQAADHAEMTDEEAPSADFPPQVLYQLLIAEIAGQRGQMNVAVVNYLAAAKESRDAGIAERAARIAVFAQALNEALEAALLWVEVDPQNPEAYQVAAPLLLAFGRAPEAGEHYEKYIALSADAPDHGLMQIAGQLALDRNGVAAMAVMEQLLESRQDNPYAWLSHAQLAMRLAKLDQALASVDKALAIKGGWAPAIVLRARILMLQGKKEAALAYLKEARDSGLQDDIAVGLSYARLLAENNQLEGARAEFERLTTIDPDNAEVFYAAGVLSLQLKDLDKAEAHLQQVLQMGNRMLEASYYLGRVYEQKHDAARALQYYFEVRHGEFYLNAQARAASLLAEQGKLERAIEHLHSLRTNNQDEKIRLYLVEGELLRKAGEYQRALDLFTAKLEESPNDTALRYARALVAEKLDKLAMTEEDLRAIIEREPSNAQALNALGYTLADRTDRYEEALQYIQRALEVEPSDAAIIDSLGWVQYRMGNYAKAVEYLRRALDLIKDPEIAAHLGEVLWTMGNKKDAIEVLEDALKEHPQHKVLLDVMKRFGL